MPWPLAAECKMITTTTTTIYLSTRICTFSAYGRRPYFLQRFWITVAHISWSLWFHSASHFFSASCRRLIFHALFSCVLVWSKGFTQPRCQVFRVRMDLSMHSSALFNIWSNRWSSIRSLGARETAFSDKICWALFGRTVLGKSPKAAECLHLRRLSIWAINPCFKPITDVSYRHTHWVTKIFGVKLA